MSLKFSQQKIWFGIFAQWGPVCFNEREPPAAVGSLETENNAGRMKIRGSNVDIMVPSQTKVLVLGLAMSLNELLYVSKAHFYQSKKDWQVKETFGGADATFTLASAMHVQAITSNEM